MGHVPEFLNELERRLRCRAERRPAVIEELRGHLLDRTEALLQQGMSEADAERQAVREMGPVWLLALRLSDANGWNVGAHLLRQAWAAGIGFFVFLGAGGVVAGLAAGGLAHLLSGVIAVLGCTLSIGLLAAFGFAMGRVVRGWVWSAVPALVCAGGAVPGLLHLELHMGALLGLAPAAVFLLAAFHGQRRESPRLHWLAWTSAGLIAVSLAGCVVVFESWGNLDLDTMRQVFGVTDPASLLAAPWLFWFVAWVIERVGRRPEPTVAG